MIRNLQLAVVGGLLHVAAILLDRLEPPRPDVDAPITDGDPGSPYLPPFTGPQLRLVNGAAQPPRPPNTPKIT